jgi:hypothetical protein
MENKVMAGGTPANPASLDLRASRHHWSHGRRSGAVSTSGERAHQGARQEVATAKGGRGESRLEEARPAPRGQAKEKGEEGLEVCRDYCSLVRARPKELVALAAFNLEVKLVAFDLGQLASCNHGAAGFRGSQMADVNFIAHGGFVFWKQAVERFVAGPFHQRDHGRRRKDALAPDVLGDEIAFDHALDAPFEPRVNAVRRRQHVDCR